MSSEPNSQFYTALPLTRFIQHADDCGVASCCDIDSIYYDFLRDKKNIVEVGAGYGRVIDYLLGKNFPGQFTALEKNQVLYEGLLQRYAKSPVIIKHQDFLTYDALAQHDAVLCLWSFISEFSHEEQGVIFRYLGEHLREGAHAFIDVMDIAAMGLDKGVYKNIDEDPLHIRLYFPSVTEIQTYCEQANLLLKSSVQYTTTQGVSRRIFVITKA